MRPTRRVGSGPFPTELLDDDGVGAGIAARGHEVGTTTGRPRRVGWFDAVSARYAVAVNSVSSIMLHKLDILSGVDPIRLCVAYEIDGRRVDEWPSSAGSLGVRCPSTRNSRAGPSRSTTSIAGRAAGSGPPRTRPARGRASAPIARSRWDRSGPRRSSGLAPDPPPAGAVVAAS
jgi:hypothetical protein